MPTRFRKGPIGGLLDEYEKALHEFEAVLAHLAAAEYRKKLRPGERLQSIRDICQHVVRAGYTYADLFRTRTGQRCAPAMPSCATPDAAVKELRAMFRYTLATLEKHKQMTDDELLQMLIKTSWSIYDAEGFWEHAIMHIHRHRRQIQIFLS